MWLSKYPSKGFYLWCAGCVSRRYGYGSPSVVRGPFLALLVWFDVLVGFLLDFFTSTL